MFFSLSANSLYVTKAFAYNIPLNWNISYPPRNLFEKKKVVKKKTCCVMKKSDSIAFL